jgi:hypothetical protein
MRLKALVPVEVRPRVAAWAFGLLLAFSGVAGTEALAASTGKVQGRILSKATGEPIAFADVALVPADTSLRRVGGLTNADGTFLLEAPAGRYRLDIRALSYARQSFEGVVVQAGQLLPFSTALEEEAIRQQEVVVEARVRQNTENAMLAVRRKAAAVGDAVSAEQVRRSPDKDAAEVLRRVTGLSVSDGKYVFVRGLGERYSSTEVDGTRIASPEQNKRVVPLDILPANLLEHIVVQKTYTADRPGEFGGGDVQVQTRDFPGARSWSFSVSQGYSENATFRRLKTYDGSSADLFGFGAGARAIPQAVFDVAGARPLLYGNGWFSKKTLAEVGKAFRDVYSPSGVRAAPNAGYSATYGDELRLFRRPLGVVQSWSFSRSFDQQNESQRYFGGPADTLYDYAVDRTRVSVQLGGLSKLSYRLSPAHSVHVSGLYLHSADDEVRSYEGVDHNQTDGLTGTFIHHRNTRLMYVQRDVLSGSVEGRHEFARLLGAGLDWKLTRSQARRQQPDRRETGYDRLYSEDANGNTFPLWLNTGATREFGDLKDNGWGSSLNGTLPFRIPRLGAGKVVFGYDRQTKDRTNFYRRFAMVPRDNVSSTAPPESLYQVRYFDGSIHTAYVQEGTLAVDNYDASQAVNAGYLSADVPLGTRVRGTFGVRVEDGSQDVRTFNLFKPGAILEEGRLANTDWLPSANLNVSLTGSLNLRLGASRTLSRPDLNELSPAPALEYVGGLQVVGNPELHRATIDNYDARLEAFPSLSEVLAAGFFYKAMHDPIEQVIRGGSSPVLKPENSDHGRNLGVELEARAALGSIWDPLHHLSLNANASIISSAITLRPQVTRLGSDRHPLQGQASYLVNAALSYTPVDRRADVTLLLAATGRRLETLGVFPMPDVYEQPTTSLDLTTNFAPFKGGRLKLAARNLLDPKVRQLQAGQEVSGFRRGRSVSIAFAFGS